MNNEIMNAVASMVSAMMAAIGVAFMMRKMFTAEVDKKIEGVERLTRLEGRVDKIEDRVRCLDDGLQSEFSEIKSGLSEIRNYLLNKK
jgi:hypothetical protein